MDEVAHQKPTQDKSILLKSKQAKILLALKDNRQEWHISDLAKATNVTYVHTSKFIKVCEELGIVASERHGKIKTVVLTEKGNQIADSLSSIMGMITKNNESVQQPS